MKKRTIIYVLVLLLALLFEYLVMEWTRVYGSIPDVVSHVGFAGTIVSIVLAVIAIIYSYYQNIAQRSDSNLLGQQLESLRNVTMNLAREGADLTAVRDQIRESLESAKRTERSVAELGARLVAAQKAKAAQEALTEIPIRGDSTIGKPEAIARFLVERASATQQGIYIGISAAAKKGIGNRQLGAIIMSVVEKRLKAKGNDSLVPTLTQWCDGIVTGHHFLLNDLGVATFQFNEQAKDDLFSQVIPEFTKAVDSMQLRKAHANELIDPEEVKAAIAAHS